MDIKGPIMGIENFKFTTFSTVPRPDRETAYILYKDGDRLGHRLIITAQQPALSCELRKGHYNKKMIVSLAPRKTSVKSQIEDGSGSYRYTVNLDFCYRIKDLDHVFAEELWNMDAEVRKKGLELIEYAHKQYEIEDKIELQKDLRVKISDFFKELNYLELMDLKVSVELDERAQRVMDSNLDTLADSVVLQNEGDRASVELAQRTRLEMQKLEAEKEIQDKKNAVIDAKVKGINGLKEEMGEDYAAFLAYASGEITSLEYDEIVRRNQSEKITAQMNVFKQLAEIDVISGPKLEEIAMKLLGEDLPENAALKAIDIHDKADDKDIIGEGVDIKDAERY